MILSSLVLYLAPDHSNDLKKYLKYLCGLIMLITLITPVLNSCDKVETVTDNIRSFLTLHGRDGEGQTVERENVVIQGAVQETAYAVMTYLQSEYGISAERISVSVVTNEDTAADPTIEELQIYIYNCSAADRVEISRNIEKMAGIRTFVFEKDMD